MNVATSKLSTPPNNLSADSSLASGLQKIEQIRTRLEDALKGKPEVIQQVLVCVLARGHLLLEDRPGLGKTTLAKALAESVGGRFSRLQCTPDLLPSDITGFNIFNADTKQFEFRSGPVFSEVLLADEINRAPAKVQSALLEAMAERQISVGKNTYPLPDLFLVMATQNPIEQEGTYPLPEAQMDRFLMHILVDYPAPETERAILALSRQEALNDAGTGIEPLSQKTLFAARQAVNQIHMTEAVEEYLVQLILATRNSESYGGDLAQWLDYGASPRATIALDRCSRSLAWMEGRDFVTPDDIRAIAHDVLRHRLILSFEAEANGITANQVIDKLLDTVPSA